MWSSELSKLTANAFAQRISSINALFLGLEVSYRGRCRDEVSIIVPIAVGPKSQPLFFGGLVSRKTFELGFIL
jgi:hypothetical protein